MGTLREEMIKEIKVLGPAELIAVQSLIDAIRQQATTPKVAIGGGRERARAALSGLNGSMAEAISSERDDRV